MDTTDKQQKLTPQQRYYQKNKETVKEKIKVSRILKKQDKHPTLDDNPVIDITKYRIHSARFRRALKAIRNGDAHSGFYEDIWIERYKGVVLEFIDKCPEYTQFKQGVEDGTKARCDRCSEVFKKRPETNQYTCWACMNVNTRGICYVSIDE